MCERVKLVVQPNFGFTMLRLSTETSTPRFDVLPRLDLDLFPSYTAGLYEENGSVLFVTRGLGNSGPSFRVFNRPEIAVLTLRRAEG